MIVPVNWVCFTAPDFVRLNEKKLNDRSNLCSYLSVPDSPSTAPNVVSHLLTPVALHDKIFL